MSTWQKYLKDIYYKPAFSAIFLGPDKLFHFAQKDGKYNLSKYQLRKWLSSQEPYSLQRPYRTSIVVAGIDDQWSADLMDLVKFAKYNDGYRYILVVINVFSEYLWLSKIKRQERRIRCKSV